VVEGCDPEIAMNRLLDGMADRFDIRIGTRRISRALGLTEIQIACMEAMPGGRHANPDVHRRSP